MSECKDVTKPFGKHFKLSSEQSPKIDEEKLSMVNVPYANVVGSLMHLMICIRSDLAYSISVVSRFMANPDKEHWNDVKWILWYVKSTLSVSLLYTQDVLTQNHLVGYVDVDYVAGCDKRRSLPGYVFTYFGNLVRWKTSLQSVVTLSATESEYIAAPDALKKLYGWKNSQMNLFMMINSQRIRLLITELNT